MDKTNEPQANPQYLANIFSDAAWTNKEKTDRTLFAIQSVELQRRAMPSNTLSRYLPTRKTRKPVSSTPRVQSFVSLV